MINEGQSTEIDNSLGECYYVRGMMYFYLCRAYGRPYYQAQEKNLGVPIVNGTPDNILDLQLDDRATVQQTYEQAITDLNTIHNGHSLTRDYPGPHNQHEEVKASDYRVTYYIPQNAINAYPGTLTQNPTDNSGVILK